MKSEIIQTSLQQFLKYGIREMSIQKLIEPLGISTKTLYKYFKNKEELLEEGLRLFYEQQLEIWQKRSADQNTVSLFFDIWYKGLEIELKVNKAFFQDLHYYYPELEKKIGSAVGIRFSKQFTQIIHKGMDEGFFQEAIIPEVVLQGIFVLFSAIVRTEQFENFRVSPYDILLNTIAPYIKGFCTQKGIQELEAHIQTLQLSVKGEKSNRKKVPVNHSYK
jgi:AcrR family transcriptional regulator